MTFQGHTNDTAKPLVWRDNYKLGAQFTKYILSFKLSPSKRAYSWPCCCLYTSSISQGAYTCASASTLYQATILRNASVQGHYAGAWHGLIMAYCGVTFWTSYLLLLTKLPIPVTPSYISHDLDMTFQLKYLCRTSRPSPPAAQGKHVITSYFCSHTSMD